MRSPITSATSCPLALPQKVEQWSLTTLRDKLIRTGAVVMGQGRYITFQVAEVAVSRALFAQILGLAADLRHHRQRLHDWGRIRMREAI